MTNLARLFLATTFVSVLTAIVLAFALINEAARSSEYSQQSYKNGQRDAELFIKGQIVRAQAEEELIEEARSHVAEERL